MDLRFLQSASGYPMVRVIRYVLHTSLNMQTLNFIVQTRHINPCLQSIFDRQLMVIFSTARRGVTLHHFSISAMVQTANPFIKACSSKHVTTVRQSLHVRSTPYHSSECALRGAFGVVADRGGFSEDLPKPLTQCSSNEKSLF